MEQTKYGLSVKRRIYSFPMKGESRAEAICQSFKQYTLVDWTKCNKVSMRIVTSVKISFTDGRTDSTDVCVTIIYGHNKGESCTGYIGHK